MKCVVVQGSIEEMPADAIFASLFEGEKELEGSIAKIDLAMDGLISHLITEGDITGRQGEISLLYPQEKLPAKRLLVIGMGKLENFNLETLRVGIGLAVRKARELGAKNVATEIHGTHRGGISHAQAASALVEGAMLGLYRFDQFKSGENKNRTVDTLALVEVDSTKITEIESSVSLTVDIIQGVFLTRDLVNLPPNLATPSHMAEVAQEIATEHDMKLTIGDRAWAEHMQMGAFLGVAKGAGEQPKFIVLEHNGDRHDLDTIVLVGKGITFDTGGISIKSSEKMEEMKSDMAGAAAVLGTMKAIGLLNIPLRIIGIAPCTENMPDSHAFHPADVITASNGKTIEIISTDAEGRLILADALVYAKRFDPNAVIDLATLTGACVTALGINTAAGMFCNDNTLSENLLRSGNRTHERVWPMPLWDDYKKKIESNVADMKNTGGRNSGVGSSAIFLKEFVNYPWAHLDIAGMALIEKDEPYIPQGATGYGVRLLVDFLQSWKK